MTQIINTRADLDALKGTPEYLPALERIKGTITTQTNIAVYPEDYGQPTYIGQEIEPVWQDVETLGIIEALGFTRASFEAEYAAATAAA